MFKLFKNKIFIFLISRYFSYFLQFLNGIIIAYLLGPYYLGIWGFITLITQYLSFGNFGIEYALNVILSTGNIDDLKKNSEITSNAILASCFTCFIFMILYFIILVFNIHLFDKYQFTHYIFLIVLITCFNYLNVLFVNLFRTFSIYNPISIFQILIQLLQLPVFFILDSTHLIHGLLIIILIGHIFSFFIFIKNIPIPIFFRVNFSIISNLYKRGIKLLFYNITFYLLLLSSRTLVSYFYSVDSMGFFTFSSNIASALIIGLSSLEFVLFPKMLNKLSLDNCDENSINIFYKIRKTYIFIVYLVVIAGLIFYPLLLLFFKSYESTIYVFCYLALCQLVIGSGFGYSTLIISRGKELFLVYHALIALVINIVFCFIGFYYFKMGYSSMALFLIIAFIYYEVQVIKKGLELLNRRISFISIFKELIPYKYLIPLLFIIISITTTRFLLFSFISLFSYLILNFKEFFIIKNLIRELISNPTIINLKR